MLQRRKYEMHREYFGAAVNLDQCGEEELPPQFFLPHNLFSKGDEEEREGAAVATPPSVVGVVSRLPAVVEPPRFLRRIEPRGHDSRLHSSSIINPLSSPPSSSKLPPPLQHPQPDTHPLSSVRRHEVIVIRGLAGSGKTWLAHFIRRHAAQMAVVQCLPSEAISLLGSSREGSLPLSAADDDEGGGSTVIVSADDFFTSPENGTYRFCGKDIGRAHAHCLSRFIEALSTPTVACIIVDNTASSRWEYANYLKLAEMHGFATRILEMECGPADSVDASERLARLQRRCVHPGISVAGMRTMLSHWEPDKRAVLVRTSFSAADDYKITTTAGSDLRIVPIVAREGEYAGSSTTSLRHTKHSPVAVTSRSEVVDDDDDAIRHTRRILLTQQVAQLRRAKTSQLYLTRQQQYKQQQHPRHATMNRIRGDPRSPNNRLHKPRRRKNNN